VVSPVEVKVGIVEDLGVVPVLVLHALLEIHCLDFCGYYIIGKSWNFYHIKYVMGKK